MRVKKRKKRSSCTSKITASLSVASKAALANNVCTPDQAGSAAAPLSVHRGRLLPFCQARRSRPALPPPPPPLPPLPSPRFPSLPKKPCTLDAVTSDVAPGLPCAAAPVGRHGHACSRTVAHARGGPPAAGRSPSSRNAYNAQHNKVCFFAVNTLYNIVYLTS